MPVSDGRIEDIIAHCANKNVQELAKVQERNDIAVSLTELRAYRAGELAPEGMVVVREADLREYIRHHADETCEEEASREFCERNSLEHFGLAPELDPAHSWRVGEEAGR